eukprot:m.38523 g.38523  ORF g.38523 m.38523 type:complete len:154 (+) comp5890_c0_seq1:3429-3890(+)
MRIITALDLFGHLLTSELVRHEFVRTQQQLLRYRSDASAILTDRSRKSQLKQLCSLEFQFAPDFDSVSSCGMVEEEEYYMRQASVFPADDSGLEWSEFTQTIAMLGLDDKLQTLKEAGITSSDALRRNQPLIQQDLSLRQRLALSKWAAEAPN